ncbi:chromatin remodelling complex Rsc7/Swp82 subunit-domain-containing protein [Gilbertella persicaria]|uniref:chromatin remodelling complex Rsc7/Swp82 subunit-domain-containing protein n=1 Tax=Gilbertella persicaria TaxID=101096 RepID=UPI00221F3AE8|nr:chromatin remodelling complex Rsc7/Swp82 subunit-domain-containing protein [Gilbertella persicaria]KAI8098375.1 chromatin remodelling complex Rsc7/Swp82 subunit-domain-containing protein [Gilbertella persicaria]
MHKKDDMPKRKRSRSQSGGLDRKDDLNYVDEDSELSSGDDALNTSDLESHHPSPDHHVRKRGRPKSHHYGSREDRHARSQQSSASSNLSNHSYHPPTTPSGYISDIDESGETKVDKYGRLLGGREYRVPTFTLPTRDNTLFMFSKDPAALLGFRDSFVFLKKNVKLIKVHIDNAEKGYLVDSNLLRSTFRTREISVVTARSVFKQFGHRIIRKGRKGRDDYYYTDEVDEGEDEPSDEEPPKDMLDKPVPASSFLPANLEVGRNNLIHQLTAQDTTTTELNWLHHAAVSTRQFNTSLFSYRRANPTNYDLLTNVYQIPENRQTLRNTEEKTNTLNSDIPMDFNLAMMNHPKMELNFNHI